MIGIRLMAAMLVAFTGQAVTPQRDARPATPAGVGTISGIVTSADAQPTPIRRARVTLTGSPIQFPRTIITADDGVFVFERVPVGEYTVAASKEGSLTMNYGASRPGRAGTAITIVGGQTVRVSMPLPRGAVLTGTVTDLDGLPAQGVTVTALARRFVAFGSQADYRYVAAGVSVGPSDDRGVYRIYGLPPGEYVVAAQPQLRAGGVAAAELRTVSNGVVSTRGLMLSQVFHPAAIAIGAASHIALRAGEERSGIDLALQYVPLASISGTVALSPGSNPPVLLLTRADEQPGFGPARNTRVDPDGRFTFSGIPPGPYRLTGVINQAPTISAPGSQASPSNAPRMFVWADVIVEGEDITNVALSPQQGFSIAGRLVFEGERTPAALPTRIPVPLAMTMANAGFAAPAVSIENDRFKIQGLVPGSYRLVGTMRGVRVPLGPWWLKSLVANGRDLLDTPLEIRQDIDDAVATFTDKASELSGLVNSPAGAASRDAWVIAFAPDRASWFYNSRRIAAVRADREGRYSIRNLAPGEYRVLATRDIEDGEWFDPAVLERLLAVATRVTIAGTANVSLNLSIR